MKKIFKLVVLPLAILSLASCGGDADDGSTKILVWVADEVVSTTETQLDAYKDYLASKEGGGYKVKFTVNAQSESNAASQMMQDMESGADIYCFAQDQLSRLVRANALNAVKGTRAAAVKENNDEASVEAAKSGETIYAYPVTSDNGYYMYYDKSVISEEHLGNLTDLIADCLAANKKISFPYDSGWYNYAFFSGAGCVSEWEVDEDGNFTSYNDTYNSEQGLAALKGLKELVHSGVITKEGSTADFASGAAVVISGTWDYANAKSNLGENLGCAELPSFTVGGESYHLGSFYGSKLMGVKPQKDNVKAALCHMTANYLCAYDCQVARFNSNGWGPSNNAAQKLDSVKNADHLLALKAQNEYGTIQGQFPSDWWITSDAIGEDLFKAGKDATDEQLQTILDNYSAAIANLIK